MKRVYFSAATAVLTFLASGGSAQSLPQMTKAAKAILEDRMLDPSSLQYRKMRIVQSKLEGSIGPMLCGQYNAKNRMGGYVGFKSFAYDPRKKLIATSDGKFFSDVEGDSAIDDETPAAPGASLDDLSKRLDAQIAAITQKAARTKAYMAQCE